MSDNPAPVIWDFSQEDYIEKFNLGATDKGLTEGVCVALSCRWARMILKAGKSFMSAPNITPKQRSNYFTKAKAPGKIAASQTLFDKLRESAKETWENSGSAIKGARELFNNGEITWEEYMKFSEGWKDSVTDSKATEYDSLAMITAQHKLKIVENITCNSFSEYFKNTKSGACYLFSSNKLEHAFAGYVTGGVFSSDYHFFDPNTGEFLASGDSNVAHLMSICKNHYDKRNKPNHSASRLRLELQS